MKNFVLIFAVLLAVSAGKVRAQDVIPAERRIDRVAQEARTSGQSAAHIQQAVSRDYPVVTSLRQALKSTVPLRVRAESKDSYVSSDGNQIVTLYKVHILENVEDFPLPAACILDDSLLPASAYSDLPESWFYVIVHGGTVKVDGVSVITPERPVSLVLGNSYLLFVRFERDRTGLLTRVATLPFGDASVYVYEPVNDSLRASTTRDNSALRTEVLSQGLAPIRLLATSPLTERVRPQ